MLYRVRLPRRFMTLRERGAAWREWRRVPERVFRQSPAGLLDPGRQVVDFLGRPEELEALVAWCEDDDASPLRLVTGPGGVGKTRLAVEVSRQLAAVGWRCERVGDGQEARAVEALRAATRSRTLLVVDYAEARSGLSELLSALASDSSGIRVLLLARSAGDWWNQLGDAEHAVRDLIKQAQAAVIELTPVVDAGMADSAVVAEAVSADFHSANQPPSLGSDLLVVTDAVAPRGPVIAFHHRCDRLPAALPLLTRHHELHGYEHFATLPARKGHTRCHLQYR